MTNLMKWQLKRLTTFTMVKVCSKENDQMSSSILFTLTAEMTHFWSVTTNSMQQYPPNNFTVRWEILCLLSDHNNDHHMHISLPLVPTQSHQMNPVFTLPSCFFKIHFNIVSYVHTGPQLVSSLHIFQPNLCRHFWFLSRMAQAQLIPSFLISSPNVSNIWLSSYSLYYFLQPH